MIKFDFQDKFIPEPEFREAIKISQNYWEFERYAEWILQEFKHRIPSKDTANSDVNALMFGIDYLELGSYAGESLYYMSQILPHGSVITLVDLPTNEAARKVLLERVAPWCQKTYGHRIKLVSGDTRNPAVAETALKYAPRGRYDLCFIDANHEFAFALNDFVRYRDKAFWISFHDISRFNTAKTIVKHGVVQANANHLWEAIKVMVPQERLVYNANHDDFDKDGSNWLEFIAYNNEPMPTPEWGQIKPRGIGVLRSQW